jgi:hypothetical protein
MYEDVGAIAWVIFIILLAWLMFCAWRTSRQQRALINALLMVEKSRIRAGFKYNEAFLLPLRRVGFGKHFWHLFTFRNAAGLYDRK